MPSTRLQRPSDNEKIHATETVMVERKKYTMQLRENARGQFVRVVEEAGNRHNVIIVPSTGTAEFIAAFNKVADPLA